MLAGCCCPRHPVSRVETPETSTCATLMEAVTRSKRWLCCSLSGPSPPKSRIALRMGGGELFTRAQEEDTCCLWNVRHTRLRWLFVASIAAVFRLATCTHSARSGCAFLFCFFLVLFCFWRKWKFNVLTVKRLCKSQQFPILNCIKNKKEEATYLWPISLKLAG